MKIEDYIGKEEHVYWRGDKNIFASIIDAIFNPTLPFIILWTVTVILMNVKMKDNAIFRQITNGWYGIVVALPYIAFAIYLICEAIIASKTKYAITNEGVYIQSGIFTLNVEKKPLALLSNATCHRSLLDRFTGTGDIILQNNRISMANNYKNDKTHFLATNIENIKDYDAVMLLITANDFHNENSEEL